MTTPAALDPLQIIAEITVQVVKVDEVAILRHELFLGLEHIRHHLTIGQTQDAHGGRLPATTFHHFGGHFIDRHGSERNIRAILLNAEEHRAVDDCVRTILAPHQIVRAVPRRLGTPGPTCSSRPSPSRPPACRQSVPRDHPWRCVAVHHQWHRCVEEPLARMNRQSGRRACSSWPRMRQSSACRRFRTRSRRMPRRIGLSSAAGGTPRRPASSPLPGKTISHPVYHI